MLLETVNEARQGSHKATSTRKQKCSIDDAHSFINDDFIGEDESFAIERESIQFNHDRLHLLNVTNGGTSALSCGNRCGTLRPVPLEAWGHGDLKGARLWLLGKGACNGSIGTIHEDCLARARNFGGRRKWQRWRLDEIAVVIVVNIVVEANARSKCRRCRRGES